MTPTASGLCVNHDPNRREAQDAARRKGGRNRRRRKTNPDEVKLRLQTVQDVQRLLEHAIADAMRLDAGVARGRLLSSLVRIAHEVVADRAVAEKLDTIEQELERLTTGITQ